MLQENGTYIEYRPVFFFACIVFPWNRWVLPSAFFSCENVALMLFVKWDAVLRFKNLHKAFDKHWGTLLLGYWLVSAAT